MERLLEDVSVGDILGDPGTVEVQSLEFDSRLVEPGALFCCLTGHVADGHRFASAAIDRGAVALLVERPLDVDVVQVVVPTGAARPAMARMACTLFDHPARSLVTVGVTGTNGKTTVTHLVASILRAGGQPTTVVGTLDGERTTPEAPVLQRIMAESRDSGHGALAMEVSSHALTQSRVEGFRFNAAVFTNLSHDHLDHHGTMEAYFEAKASLFQAERAEVGVINIDDLWGRRLVRAAGIPTVAYDMSEVDDIEDLPGRTRFSWRGRRVELALTGAHQVANAMAAATTALVLGTPEDAIVEGLAAAPSLPGRFEVVMRSPVTVIVDYAHTPDALQTAIESARRLAGGGRVVCVFGCGGGRDQAKRPVMGKVASDRADVTIITSDNPRHEDPAVIIEQVVAGASGPARLIVEPDRRRAIALSMDEAGAGDVVLVAGKGHEKVLEVGGGTVPFDDSAEAASAAQARWGSASTVGERAR